MKIGATVGEYAQEINAWFDVYSFGVSIYPEILEGARPKARPVLLRASAY